MRPNRVAFAPLALAAIGWAGSAGAVSFDPSGNLSFDSAASMAESFEAWTPPEDSPVQAEVAESSTALHGQRVLRLTLAEQAFALALPVGEQRTSYRLSFWIQGDVIGGAAVDYDDGTPGAYVQAFPTGRLTSDGWVEMATAPLQVDGAASGIDARMFLRAYDASEPLVVDVDAIELVDAGAFQEPATCTKLGDSACGPEQMCLAGVCRDARGWFPPLPEQETRDRFIEYWKVKIPDTFGPYLPRKHSMPQALLVLEQMRTVHNNVAFWSKFSQVIRLLRDAHTYTRAPYMSALRIDRPLNACFVQGKADLSTDAWASDPLWPDVLVSHVGPDFNWGLQPGDRLVAIDGIHPVAWGKKAFPVSEWTWEADDPEQLANLFMMMRNLIHLHARTVTVIRCDASAGTCSDKPEVIEVRAAQQLPPGETVTLVGCDHRPLYHVPGAPEDHLFGPHDKPIIVEGQLTASNADERIRNLVWNTLYGNGKDMPADIALLKATSAWNKARGVIQDHREGHGGTVATTDILVRFSRQTFMPMVSVMRMHAADQGPADEAEGIKLFNKLKSSMWAVVAGSEYPKTHIPVAMLLSWDVSASDFLPYIMKGGPKVRLFGPGPTMGAFGTFYQYSYWGGMLWSIGVEDSLSPEGVTLSGHGVMPDVLVQPTQSDLLAGKDTVHEAALAWVREELAP